MAEIPETVLQTLIAVVGHFRNNRNTIATKTLQNKDGITPTKLDLALPFIRLRSKIDNSGRVQCVEQGRGTIGPVTLYNYRCDNRCPLFDGVVCKAENALNSGRQIDKRQTGAPRFTKNGQSSKRSARS
jgi:hypothetical protein